jgi:hypothetical protein
MLPLAMTYTAILVDLTSCVAHTFPRRGGAIFALSQEAGGTAAPGSCRFGIRKLTL